MFIELLSLIAGAGVLVATISEATVASPLGIAIAVGVGVLGGTAVFWGIRRGLNAVILSYGLSAPKLPGRKMTLAWFLLFAAAFGAGLMCLGTIFFTRFIVKYFPK